MVKEINDAPNPILEGMMSRRTVFMEGELTPKLMSDVSSRMLELQLRSHDPINLIINSGGGHVFPALALCDLMTDFMTAPVRGIVKGSYGSAATFIILHCHERVATRYSRFLLHSGNRGGIALPIGSATSKMAEQLVRDIKGVEDIVMEQYIERLTPTAWKKKKPSAPKQREYVQTLLDRGDQDYDGWMSAREAIEVGLITDIITKKLDIFQE